MHGMYTPQAFNWNHGVYLGTAVSSEPTAAAETKTKEIKHDPFAMNPFCGYNMADYFGQWLSLGDSMGAKTKFFNVNWFDD